MPRSRVAASSACKATAARPQTFLARPFIPLDVAKSGVLWNLRDQVQPEPSWTTSASFLRHVEGADEFFRRSIAAHPVLVRQSLHRLQQGHGIPTVAFCGRSNAGKSSLVNGLLFGRQVARASKTPGRTRQLFTFEVGRDEHLKEEKGKPLRIVDLPGLGFAKGIDAEQKAEWRALVGEYMERADNLRLVLSFWPYVHCVSAQDGHGMPELRAALVEAMDRRYWKKKKKAKPN